ncbi:MAG TPA: aldo/keto reductase [Longimicrobium sp.]
METVALGRTGVRVSRIGFGCAAMGGYDYGAADDRASIGAVHRALELGISLFDTADVYGLGHAEEVLGRALAGRRDEAVVATKVGVRWDASGRTRRDLSPGYVAQAVEASLRRLRMERIDLLQLHWPDPETPLEDTLGAAERLREAGKVAVLGCCNFDAALVERGQRAARLESLQLPYSLAERGHEAVIHLAAHGHGMAVMTYNALAQGLFTGKYGRGSAFEGTDLRQRSPLFRGEALERNLATLDRLREVAAAHGKTPAQTAVRWLLDAPGVAVVLTGVRTARQAEENAAATGWSLSDDERAYLEGADASPITAGSATPNESTEG